MSKLESSLVGRTINSIPPGIIHTRNDLPDSAVLYRIHIVFSDSNVDGEPMVYAEMINEDDVREEGGYIPDNVKVMVGTFGTLWNLHPVENDDES